MIEKNRMSLASPRTYNQTSRPLGHYHLLQTAIGMSHEPNWKQVAHHSQEGWSFPRQIRGRAKLDKRNPTALDE
jgi:hypothetical protein